MALINLPQLFFRKISNHWGVKMHFCIWVCHKYLIQKTYQIRLELKLSTSFSFKNEKILHSNIKILSWFDKYWFKEINCAQVLEMLNIDPCDFNITWWRLNSFNVCSICIIKFHNIWVKNGMLWSKYSFIWIRIILQNICNISNSKFQSRNFLIFTK